MLFVLSLAATPVSAVDIAVSGNCSLAEAIENANDDAPTNSDCAAGSGHDTITLSANVTPTDLLPTIDSQITIDGAGFKITHLGSAALYNGAILRSTAGSNLTLKKVTLEYGGGGSSSHGALVLGDDATITDVSFNLCYLTCVQGVASGATYSLGNVHFSYTFGAYYTPGAIMAQAGAFTINKVAFYQMSDAGNGLIGISSGASVTLTGCLYRYQVLPQLKSGSGTLTNNSSGTCSGTIGNNTTLFVPLTTEHTNACGLYEGWPVISVDEAVSRTVSLTANCNVITSPTYVPHNLHLTISSPSGSRYAINSVKDNNQFKVAGQLTLSNVDLVGRIGPNQYPFALFAIVAYYAKGISLQDVIIRPENASLQWLGGLQLAGVSSTTLTRVTIQDHQIPANDWRGSAITLIGQNNVLISDTTFSNNRGGVGAILALHANSRVNLSGTNTFADNTPVNIRAAYGALTGNRPDNVTIVGSPPPDSGGGGGGGGGGGPAVYTGEQLLASGLRLWAEYGLSSGIQFQRRTLNEVGIQSLIDGGVLDAVDVWGYAEQDWEVCFPQAGAPVFLDAAGMPRVPEQAAGYRDEGYTCIANDRAGMVVLQPGTSPAAAAAVGAERSVAQGQSLQNCMVRTKYIVNFRETPGGELLHYEDPWGREVPGWLPWDVTLTALERRGEWYRVDYYGTRGWVSADYVTELGDCT